MNEKDMKEAKMLQMEEKPIKHAMGMAILLLNTVALLVFIALFVLGVLIVEGVSAFYHIPVALGIVMTIVGAVMGFVVSPMLYAGLKIVRPNEALVFTLFGKYVGTLKGEGFYFVNPFCVAVAPPLHESSSAKSKNVDQQVETARKKDNFNTWSTLSKKVSLKAITLNNERQKINDCLGNPIIIGIVVIWKVNNTAKAMFNVDNYYDFLSIQCDSALRNIVRLYPYDLNEDGNEKSLRGSSIEIAERLKGEIQEKVDIAGLEVMEARITHLSYAPEIAAAMLQRQQAAAIVDARQLIVEGAVGMVKTALEKLNEDGIVELDEERKAAMVSNLLVVLCGNRDAQPIVNSGTIY